MDKKNFFNALLKTKYGDNLKKKMKKKSKKIPLSLKALGAAGLAASKKGDIDIKKTCTRVRIVKLYLKEILRKEV